jgi:hypothetical protein
MTNESASTENGVYVKTYEATDPRLKRRVRHDRRSIRYAYPVYPKAVRLQRTRWQRRIPILDQGQVGCCTTNAFTGLKGTDSATGQGSTSVVITDAAAANSQGLFTAGTVPLDEAFALTGYSLETRLDSFPGQYPPDDTGSDALGAMVMGQNLGLVDTYLHAFSIAALQSALANGAVMWGTLWLNSMFDVDPNGFIKVDKRSGTAGGHELILSGYDPETDAYDLDNSWGGDWGQDGSAKVHGADLKWLLAQDGDITVPQWTSAPSPVPPPVPEAADAQLWAQMLAWGRAKGYAA